MSSIGFSGSGSGLESDLILILEEFWQSLPDNYPGYRAILTDGVSPYDEADENGDRLVAQAAYFILNSVNRFVEADRFYDPGRLISNSIAMYLRRVDGDLYAINKVKEHERNKNAPQPPRTTTESDTSSLSDSKFSHALIREVWNALCGSKTKYASDRDKLGKQVNFLIGTVAGSLATKYGMSLPAASALVAALFLFAAKIGIGAFCAWASIFLA